MMNRKVFLSLGAALAMSATACDPDKVTEANNNPNDPTDAPSTALFTNATRNATARWVDGVNGTRYGFLPQHQAQVQYPDDDQYLSARLGAAATSGLFNGSYNTELQDLKLVIDRGTAAGLPGLSGPAQILSLWEFGILTDVFGDVPYSEAFNPTILKPAYDPQRNIYVDLFAKLAAASTSLTGATNQLGSGDPIYGGDPVSWQRFANSLRLRHALRIANTGIAADLTMASTEAAAAFSGPGGLIDANSENAQLAWPGDGIYDNPWAANFRGRDDNRISARLMSWWSSHQDPRVLVLAQPVDVDPGTIAANRGFRYCPPGVTGNCYIGLINALTQAQAAPFVPNTSRVGAARYPGVTSYGTFGGSGASYPSRLFTAAETEFLLAEAKERGIGGATITGTAAQHYINGITLHMQMVGVPAASIATYLARPEIIYTPGTAGLVQIAEQKWMALFEDPIQAWSEVRRTCRPAFVEPGPSARFAIIPRRLQYSTTEKAVNVTSYNAALASLTPASDVMTARFYWDKNTGAGATAGTGNPTYVLGCSDRAT